MLAWLVVCSLSGESISITVDNYRNLSDEQDGKPLLVDLWDPFCAHCKAFRPTWNAFVNQSKFSRNIIFGDINCLASNKLCKSVLRVTSYPQVLFWDIARNLTISFDGAMTVPGLESFVEKQLTFPIRMIADDSELQEAKLVTNISSLFYLEFEDARQQSLENLKIIATSLRAEDCVFIARRASQTRLLVFKSLTVSIPYPGDWSLESLSAFVKSNIFCLLAPLTGRVLDQFTESGQYMFIVFLHEAMYDSVLKVSETVTFKYPLFYEVYGAGALLGKVMNVKEERLPQYVLADPNRTQFISVPVNSSAELQNWMDRLQIANIKWEGGEKAPGIMAMMELGGWPVYVICACLSAVVAVVVWVIRDARRMIKEEGENRKSQ
jgi:thiol-disulfide isomerase/thioredoxin